MPAAPGDAVSGRKIMKKLLVVEDHALVREGVVAALQQRYPNCRIVQARDADSALSELDHDFDLTLLDLLLPGMDGFAFLGVMRQRFPTVPVLVVSALGDAATIDGVAGLGASGFVHKTRGIAALLDAVRVVLEGGTYFSPPDTERGDGQHAADEEVARRMRLTAAQSRVLALLADGRSNKEISELLGLTVGTVKVHLTAIYRALNVTSRAQALVVVRRRGR